MTNDEKCKIDANIHFYLDFFKHGVGNKFIDCVFTSSKFIYKEIKLINERHQDGLTNAIDESEEIKVYYKTKKDLEKLLETAHDKYKKKLDTLSDSKLKNTVSFTIERK